MKVGFVGLGKLGLPCALAIERFGGHAVLGTDTSAEVLDSIRRRLVHHKEDGMAELWRESNLRLAQLADLVEESDIVFVAVQTPHCAEFEGIGPLPEGRSDFDYGFLIAAVKAISQAAASLEKDTLVAIISTVLPGTIRQQIAPLLSSSVSICYNPFFIAMGTTIRDFMNPEFVLLGADEPDVHERMSRFFSTLHRAPIVRTSIESAELVKVAYNTFIGMKIAFANTLMETCEGTGADVDVVVDALSLATERLVSPRYLRAGMGDGGGCHPRDNIAMSYLARKLDLSYDFLEAIMMARERQTAWLAELAISHAQRTGLPIIVMGKAFKPETDLTAGSPAILLSNLLKLRGHEPLAYDPHIDPDSMKPTIPGIYIIGTRHAEFADWPFPEGSVVLDPWRYVTSRVGVLTHRLGSGQAPSR